MPERWGLLLVFAAVGLIGGGAASAALSPKEAPTLWDVSRRLITGLFCGLVVGGGLMWKLGSDGLDDGEVYLSIASCAAAGFVGPYGLWRWAAAKDARIPAPPEHDGDAP